MQKNNENDIYPKTTYKLSDIISEFLDRVPDLDEDKFLVCFKKVLDILPLNQKEQVYFRKMHSELLKRGWYITSEFVSVHEIYDMTDEGIEGIMQEYALEQKGTILIQIKEAYPDRYNIIKEAFYAHDNGLYNISIPAMLAQTDGIAKEIFNVSLYSKERKLDVPKTKYAKDKIITWDLEEDNYSYVS